VDQVELEDLKLANLTRKKQRPKESEYEQRTHKRYTLCKPFGFEYHSLQNRWVCRAEHQHGSRPPAQSESEWQNRWMGKVPSAIEECRLRP